MAAYISGRKKEIEIINRFSLVQDKKLNKDLEGERTNLDSLLTLLTSL